MAVVRFWTDEVREEVNCVIGDIVVLGTDTPTGTPVGKAVFPVSATIVIRLSAG